MKLLAKILMVLLLFSCACSHTTTNQFAGNHYGGRFLTDNGGLQVRSSSNTLQLKLSQHASINVDLKSIAAYVQSTDINRDQYFLTDEGNNQPWAVCHISF
jgi:hypothetical protein